MKRLLSSLTGCLFAASLTAAGPLYQCDFETVPQNMKSAGKGVKIANGILDINAVGVQSSTIPLNQTSPCEISFKMRIAEQPRKGGHAGITLAGGDYSLMIYTRGKGVEILTRFKGKQISLNGYLGNLQLKIAPDAPWTEGTLTVLKDKVIFNFAKQAATILEIPFLPIKSAYFYSYNYHAQFDDFKIMPVDMKSFAKIPSKLIFSETFDKTGNIPGISGSGFELPQPKRPPKGPIRYSHNQWAKDGVFGIDSFRGISSMNFPADIKGDFTVRFKALQRKVSPKGYHWGFHFSGTGNQDVHLFCRGQVWTCIQSDGAKKSHKDYSTQIEPEAGLNVPWMDCVITRKNGKFMVSSNGEEMNLDYFKFPVKTMSFYALSSEISIKDLVIESKNFKFRPDFSQDFSTKPVKRTAEFKLPQPIGKAGLIMFWYRINRDTAGTNDTFHVMRLATNDPKINAAHLFLWTWFRCDVSQKNGLKGLSFQRRNRSNWFKNDWHHLALAWDSNGDVRFYQDGMPYMPNNFGDSHSPRPSAHQLADITKIQIKPGWDIGEAAYDRIFVYSGDTSKKVIYDEYRKFMPVDMVFRDSVADPETPFAPVVRLAPGGFYMRPMPVKAPLNKAKVKVRLIAADKDGKEIESTEKEVFVGKPMDISLSARNWAEGDYKITAVINGTARRTWRFRSVSAAKPVHASDNDIRIGKKIYQKIFTTEGDPELLKDGLISFNNKGGYLECGPDKGNRFAMVIPFPKNVINNGPVILEVEWPDDKPRSMGLYMYRPKPMQCRDRLQGGIQSGNEYPLTHKFVRTRYLFYPGEARYLFEARTMAKGYPAAVKAVRIYEIEGGLPKLALNLPKGLPSRGFGFDDEDQTVQTSLTSDLKNGKPFLKNITEKILEYFDYTGQNIYHSPVLRYANMNYYALEGSADVGVVAGGVGELPWFIRQLNKRGVKFTPIFATTNILEGTVGWLCDDTVPAEWVMRNRSALRSTNFSIGKNMMNFAHPGVRAAYMNHAREIADTFARIPGNEAFELWITRFGCWPSLEDGYDKATLTQFTRDTGIKLPADNVYEFLTGKVRKQWLAWRAQQVTKFVKALRDTISEVNPKLPLFIAFGAFDPEKMDQFGNTDIYTKNGIDVKALSAIPGVYLTSIRNQTNYRWMFHWGKPESDYDAVIYNQAAQSTIPGYQHMKFTLVYPAYYETFTNSLNMKEFPSYFENADVKPHGRYFLKELAFNVAAFDSQNITIGAQPLGTWGRDELTREFARAYRALPQLPFELVESGTDPVTVRQLNTKNGTYFYVVSTVFAGTTVKLNFSGETTYTDLSTGKTLSGNEITLKGYELRSFLIPSGKMVKSFSVTLSKAGKDFYAKRIAVLKNAIDTLQFKKVDVSAEKAVFASIKKAEADGRYAELHRLAFRPEMNQLITKLKNLANVIRQAEMIRNNTFAVDCGGSHFYNAPNGKLFFADHPYSNAARYGYFGNYNSVGRSITNLKGSDTPGVFQSEAYDIDGYKFKVANGTYTVKLYMKIGFGPDFKPDQVIFSVLAQDKPLFTEKDLFKSVNGDASKGMILEFRNIRVTNGMLTLSFKVKGRGGNFRLCNAIEVSPQK